MHEFACATGNAVSLACRTLLVESKIYACIIIMNPGFIVSLYCSAQQSECSVCHKA